MREELKPAIEALQGDLADLERQVAETKQVINRLCVRAGLDPLYPDAIPAASASVGALRPDSFYGKSVTTAAREYLEMRRAAGLGPATPREIYEALEKGGYTFEAKDATNAIISVRATVRKSSSIFHRLPNGTYGLLTWYPNARAARPDEVVETRSRSKSGKTKKASTRKPKGKAAPPRSEQTAFKSDRIRDELRAFLDGGPQSRLEILAHLKSKGLMGDEKNPLAQLSAYLSKWRDELVVPLGDGKWGLAAKQAA